LIGYRTEFLTATSGRGLLSSSFEVYKPLGNLTKKIRNNGVLISKENGKCSAFSIFNLQSRGKIMVSPGEEVFEGMIVGIHSRENDLVVNPTKGKQLTNIRAASSDENIVLTPRTELTLEQALEFIEEDELVDVTPAAIRLRKKILKESERKKTGRKNLSN
ncbi:MAG: translational GTPase TypA, partial [Pseudomonadota bacterium]|nr:translational GTPase TypA [Pseudomonadota bacterium]